MGKDKKLIQRLCIYFVFLALAVFFIVMGWWIALASEAVVAVTLIIVIAFYMVNWIIKRKYPVLEDDVSVLGKRGELRDDVKDAVMWLETGELWDQISYDGLKLYGRFMKNEGSHTYAICCHGYKNHRMQDISNQAKKFYEMGHNVFCPHARGHGRSEGTYVGMGCKERRDICDWIRMIIERDPGARIFLYGVSMGGSTVMATAGEELPDNVKCAIEDCGYSSAWDEYSYHIKKVIGLPYRPILDLCQVISRHRYGFGFKEYSAKEQVKRSRIPLLFIHGDKDTFVPYEMMMPMYESCTSEHKKSLTFPDAEHVESYKKDPDRYWEEVGAWLDTYL